MAQRDLAILNRLALKSRRRDLKIAIAQLTVPNAITTIDSVIAFGRFDAW